MKLSRIGTFILALITLSVTSCEEGKEDISVYSGNKIEVNYNGTELNVAVSAIFDGRYSTLSLVNIIPGHNTLTINGISKNDINGSVSEGDMSADVKGKMESGKLVLEIDLKRNNEFTGTWKTKNITMSVEKENGEINFGDKTYTEEEYGNILAELTDMAEQMIDTVYFKGNGFLTAGYRLGLAGNYAPTPEYAVHYYTEANQAHILPNASYFIARLFTKDDNGIADIISNTDIPLQMKVNNDGSITLTAGHNLLKTALPIAKNLIENMNESGMNGMIKAMVLPHLDAIISCDYYTLNITLVPAPVR